MYLARIAGSVVSVVKHATLEGSRLSIAQRLAADGSTAAEPILIVDWMGAANGATVLVSTDGDIARQRLGNTTPVRLTVVGIVDQVQMAKQVRK
jgi:ethanolamine utilization protein EutN